MCALFGRCFSGVRRLRAASMSTSSRRIVRFAARRRRRRRRCIFIYIFSPQIFFPREHTTHIYNAACLSQTAAPQHGKYNLKQHIIQTALQQAP